MNAERVTLTPARRAIAERYIRVDMPETWKEFQDLRRYLGKDHNGGLATVDEFWEHFCMCHQRIYGQQQ